MKNKLIIYKVLVGIAIVCGLVGATLQVASWFDNNKIVTEGLQVDVTWPSIKVEKREIVEPIVQIQMDYPTEVDTPIKEYVCELFDAHCREALAIVQCESGWKEDALGINDPSVGYKYRADAGIFQINSVHWGENGGLGALLDPYHNADVAKQLFDQSGWNPWYSHGTLCFKEAL